jgi:hypothetical protein
VAGTRAERTTRGPCSTLRNSSKSLIRGRN